MDKTNAKRKPVRWTVLGLIAVLLGGGALYLVNKISTPSPYDTPGHTTVTEDGLEVSEYHDGTGSRVGGWQLSAPQPKTAHIGYSWARVSEQWLPMGHTQTWYASGQIEYEEFALDAAGRVVPFLVQDPDGHAEDIMPFAKVVGFHYDEAGRITQMEVLSRDGVLQVQSN